MYTRIQNINILSKPDAFIQIPSMINKMGCNVISHEIIIICNTFTRQWPRYNIIHINNSLNKKKKMNKYFYAIIRK